MHTSPRVHVASTCAGILGAGLLYFLHDEQRSLHVTCTSATRKDRLIPLEEVQTTDRGVWVTFRGGVYDVTEFLDAHPGGPHRIAMVAGQDLEAFWKVYDLHKQRPHILRLLEKYRIGSLKPADAKRAQALSVFDSAYKYDPPRDEKNMPWKSELHIPSEHPWNHEPSLDALTKTFYTPNELFFVRNHNPVPDIDVGDYELEVSGDEKACMKSRTFTLADLKDTSRFPPVEVVSTLQCAGNRQQDFVLEGRPLWVAPHWNNTAIGCAKWKGVRVRDVLAECGLDVDGMALGKTRHPHVKMVNFIAEDVDETGVPYAGVLPIGKVTDPFGDAILAYEMNGETLPRDHGYPVRLIAPGHAGCRNVKWVSQIHLSAAASKLDSGSKLDRHFSPQFTFIDHVRHGDDMVRLDQGPVIQTFPVQSVLCGVAGLTNGAATASQLRQQAEAGTGCFNLAATPKTPFVTKPDVGISIGSEDSGRIEVVRTTIPPSFGQNGHVSANIIGKIDGVIDALEVAGVAWSGGGRGICRVEVSIDGGENFCAAELACAPEHAKEDDLYGAPESGQGKHWAWVQYKQAVPLTEEMKLKLQRGQTVDLDVCIKAVDGDMNSQPEKMVHAWNVLGICPNHWPRAKVTVSPCTGA